MRRAMVKGEVKGRGRGGEEKFGLARPGTAEWRQAWKGLAALTGDDDFTAEDPESGEVWQYMGSGLERGRWRHSFRHRWHPMLQRRWVVSVPASTGWRPLRG